MSRPIKFRGLYDPTISYQDGDLFVRDDKWILVARTTSLGSIVGREWELGGGSGSAIDNIIQRPGPEFTIDIYDDNNTLFYFKNSASGVLDVNIDGSLFVNHNIQGNSLVVDAGVEANTVTATEIYSDNISISNHADLASATIGSLSITNLVTPAISATIGTVQEFYATSATLSDLWVTNTGSIANLQSTTASIESLTIPGLTGNDLTIVDGSLSATRIELSGATGGIKVGDGRIDLSTSSSATSYRFEDGQALFGNQAIQYSSTKLIIPGTLSIGNLEALHASTHRHGGTDEIATSTPAANTIPKADANSTLLAWIPNATTSSPGKVTLAPHDSTVAGTVVQATDPRLSNARQPVNNFTVAAATITALTSDSISTKQAQVGDTSKLLIGEGTDSIVTRMYLDTSSMRFGTRLDRDELNLRAGVTPAYRTEVTINPRSTMTGTPDTVIFKFRDTEHFVFGRTDVKFGNQLIQYSADKLTIPGVLNVGTLEAIHASTHASNGTDPIDPVDIGAVADSDVRLTNARVPLSHAISHQHGGSDELATVTPTANSIPKADANNLLAPTWLPLATTAIRGSVILAPSGGTIAGTVVQATDTRLTDERTPTAHKSTHATGGSDEITPPDIGAVADTDPRLSDARTPTAHKSTHVTGGSDELTPADIGAAASNDPRFTDARAPLAHAVTHKHGGVDEIGTATPGDNAIPKAGSTGKLAVGWLPTATTTADGVVTLADLNGTTAGTVIQATDPRLSNARTPTAHASTHAADGSDPIDLTDIGAVSDTDPRLSDARTPTAHKTTHATGGTDEITPSDIGAVPTTDPRLSDARTPLVHASTHAVDGSDPIDLSDIGAVADNDPRLSDSRTPTAHSLSHQHGGSDEIATATPAANAIPKSGSNNLLAANWLPLATTANRGAVVLAASGGTTAGTVIQATDSRLSDSRTPTAHKATHATGGSDPITPADIGAVSTTDSRLSDARTPTSHATSHRHGGTDEIAVATPAANAIPKANASGRLDSWISDATTSVSGKVRLAAHGGTTASTVVQATDPRLSDSRPPGAHKSTHATGGSDELTPADIGATASDDPRLSDARTPTAHASTHAASGSDPIDLSDIGAVADNDPRLSDARTPTAHKATHATGGSDEITPADIGAVVTTDPRLSDNRHPTDNFSVTRANVTTSLDAQQLKVADRLEIGTGGESTRIYLGQNVEAAVRGIFLDGTTTRLGTRYDHKRLSLRAGTTESYRTEIEVNPRSSDSTTRDTIIFKIRNQEHFIFGRESLALGNQQIQYSTSKLIIPGTLNVANLEAIHASTHAAGGSDPIDLSDIGAVADNDPRLTDARTPTAHKSTHETGGADELTPADIGAVATTDPRLTDARTPTAHASTHAADGSDPLDLSEIGAVADNDPRLSDSRTPTSHASSHKHGGTDEIATATPAANVIPKTGASGKLDSWISAGSTSTAGILRLAAHGGTTANTVVQATDPRLSDFRTPTTHKSTHATGGSDELTPADIGAAADNDPRFTNARTPLSHASSHRHGGSDEIAVATPAANAIPKAGEDKKLGAGWLPLASTTGLGVVQFAGHGDSLSETAVQATDPRLSDSRTPQVHAATHRHGGADEIATATPGNNAIPKAGGTGKLAAGWLPAATTTTDGVVTLADLNGTTAGTVIQATDPRLSNPRVPTLHKLTHQTGGIDELTPADIGAIAEGDSRLTDARTPTAHASTHRHGGADEIAVATPANNAIPKAGGTGKLDAGWLPYTNDTDPGVVTLSMFGGTSGAHAVRANDPRLSDSRTPTAHKSTHATGGSDALTPADIGAVADTDPRLTDARTPTAHATTHQHGGTDEIATAAPGNNAIPKAGTSGKLASGWLPEATTAALGAVQLSAHGDTTAERVVQATDPRLSDSRTPTAHASTHAADGTDPIDLADIGAVASNDPRLTNARTPLAHKSTHATGGTDEITPSDIGAVADTDPRLTDARTPTAHASTHKHGGVDEIATATPISNAIPKALATGKLDASWMPGATISTQGVVTLSAHGGTTAGEVVQATDPRLSDARTPTTHKSTHSTGGSDELAPADIGAAATTDPRLSDARTPTAHASTHQHGGTDEIATATPGSNAIPKAGGTGKLDAGWLPYTDDTNPGAVTLAPWNGTAGNHAVRASDPRLSNDRHPTNNFTVAQSTSTKLYTDEIFVNQSGANTNSRVYIGPTVPATGYGTILDALNQRLSTHHDNTALKLRGGRNENWNTEILVNPRSEPTNPESVIFAFRNATAYKFSPSEIELGTQKIQHDADKLTLPGVLNVSALEVISATINNLNVGSLNVERWPHFGPPATGVNGLIGFDRSEAMWRYMDGWNQVSVGTPKNWSGGVADDPTLASNWVNNTIFNGYRANEANYGEWVYDTTLNTWVGNEVELTDGRAQTITTSVICATFPLDPKYDYLLMGGTSICTIATVPDPVVGAFFYRLFALRQDGTTERIAESTQFDTAAWFRLAITSILELLPSNTYIGVRLDCQRTLSTTNLTASHRGAVIKLKELRK